MSWNLGNGEEFLPDVSLEELNKLYSAERQAKPKQRLLCALRRKQGESIDAISNTMHMNRRTVHEIIRRFDERGIPAKDSIKQSGRPPLLTEKQCRRLVADLERGPPHNMDGMWSTKEVRHLLSRKYGVSFVNQHIWRILTSMGFTMQRPRKRHYKSATDAEMEAFKKTRSGLQGIAERKALLWAQRMRQHSG